MKRFLLLGLFVGLMADGMFGWGLGIAPGLSLKNALLYLLVLIFGLEVAVAGKMPDVPLPSIHLWFASLIFVAFLSWAANSFIGMYVDYSPIKAFMTLKGAVIDHYLFFLVFFVGVNTQRDVIWLQKWLLVVIVIGSISTVMDTYNLPDLNIVETSIEGRVEGPLGEANQYGLFVAMFLPILVAKAWTEQGAWRAFLAVGAAANLWVLILTVSRGAFVALIAGSLISAVILRDNLKSLYVKRVLAIGLFAVIGIAMLLGEEYASLVTERLLDTTAGGDAFAMTSGRTWIWGSALEAMLKEPWSILTGYGLRTFRSVNAVAPHNFYLDRFFELGIFGLLASVGLMMTILLYAKRAASVRRANIAAVSSSMGFFFGFAILMVGIFFVDLADPWYFVWAYVGLAMRQCLIILAAPNTHPLDLRAPGAEAGVSASRENQSSSGGANLKNEL